MNNKKYPISLFVFGFLQNFFLHFFWLFIPAVILLIVGIFIKPCLYIGGIVLVADLIASLVEQLLIRKTCLSDSDNPDFKAFQDALFANGDWKENVDEYVKNQISKYENSSDDNEK